MLILRLKRGWLQGKGKSPIEWVHEMEPIECHGLTVASYGCEPLRPYFQSAIVCNATASSELGCPRHAQIHLAVHPLSGHMAPD